MHWVEIPGGRAGPVWRVRPGGVESQPVVPEQIVLTRKQSIGARRRMLNGVRKRAPDARDQRRLRPGADREPLRRVREMTRQRPLPIDPPARRQRGAHIRQRVEQSERWKQISPRPLRGDEARAGAVEQRPRGRRPAPRDLGGVHVCQARDGAVNHRELSTIEDPWDTEEKSFDRPLRTSVSSACSALESLAAGSTLR